MKLLQQCTLVLFLCIHAMSFGQENLASVITEKYDAQLTEKNKGVAILTKKDTKIEKASLGNFNLTEQSVFSIGSATKTFTAILLLQEVEKGTIQLSDSIGKYLSPITNVDPSLTIEMLLTHTSGLDEVVGKNIVDIFYSKDDSVYNQSLLSQIEENNPEMIGTFSYCNTNYLLLGKILEKINDQHYFDLLEQRIFKPLQLNNTYAYLHKNIKNLAPPTFDNKDVTDRIDHRFYGDMANAAGSIASTLSDMQLFYTSLFETEKLLKKESLQLMLSSGNEYYGLGIFKMKYNDIQYYGHGGNNIGYAFSNGYNPITKELFLLFTNSIAMPLNAIEDDVIGYLNDQKMALDTPLDVKNYTDVLGTYLIKEADLVLKITQEGDKMYLVSEGQGVKDELTLKNTNTLYEAKYGVTLERIDGDTNALKFSQNGFETIIKRVN